MSHGYLESVVIDIFYQCYIKMGCEAVFEIITPKVTVHEVWERIGCGLC